jgi:hypothetical protein
VRDVDAIVERPEDSVLVRDLRARLRAGVSQSAPRSVVGRPDDEDEPRRLTGGSVDWSIEITAVAASLVRRIGLALSDPPL